MESEPEIWEHCMIEDDDFEDCEDYHNQKNKSWYPGNIYVIDYGDMKQFKIGHTTVDPIKRFNQIAKGDVLMPMHLVMHAEVDSNCKQLEDLLHMKYDSNHIRGEWFDFSFMELVELYQALETFASVQLHQRWYEIVPND